MSTRIPPCLQYLAIYNPTLPSPHHYEDREKDEDAQQHAQILFYTAKDHAVSRDRILRQIGLAKALFNFSGIFNAKDPCANVHSQSRRMITVSPEPNFWIHACIEVAKYPRQHSAGGSNKSKGKVKLKVTNGKDGTYDYDDSSVNDIALCAEIKRAYEHFKLTHGSFSHILRNLGQQALELQLERFFTVWAWSWNLEVRHRFEDHLGVLCHPSSSTIVKYLDEFGSQLLDDVVPIVLAPPHVILSSRFTDAAYPPSLINYISSKVPLMRPLSLALQSAPEAFSPSIRTVEGIDRSRPSGRSESERESIRSKATFLGLPTLNVTMNINARKWNWPGYLSSFGKNVVNDATRGPANGVPQTQLIQKLQASNSDDETPSLEVGVSPSMDDGISSDVHSIGNPNPNPSDDEEKLPASPEGLLPRTDLETLHDDLTSGDGGNMCPSSPSMRSPATPTLVAQPESFFSSMSVYVSSADDATATSERKVHYVSSHGLVLALIGVDKIGCPEMERKQVMLASKTSLPLLDKIRVEINDEALKSASAPIPSAAQILQPCDQYLVSTDSYVLPSSSGFKSDSGHLFDAKIIQETHSEISEVFSRGQNPQHWHIIRRERGFKNNGEMVDRAVYLEVFRKETTLGDVDNALAGILTKSTSG